MSNFGLVQDALIDFEQYEIRLEQILDEHNLSLSNLDKRVESNSLDYSYTVDISSTAKLKITLSFSNRKEKIELDYYNTIENNSLRMDSNHTEVLLEIYNSISSKHFEKDIYHSYLTDEKYVIENNNENGYTEKREINLDFFERWRSTYYVYPENDVFLGIPVEYHERIYMAGLI